MVHNCSCRQYACSHTRIHGLEKILVYWQINTSCCGRTRISNTKAGKVLVWILLSFNSTKVIVPTKSHYTLWKISIGLIAPLFHLRFLLNRVDNNLHEITSCKLVESKHLWRSLVKCEGIHSNSMYIWRFNLLFWPNKLLNNFMTKWYQNKEIVIHSKTQSDILKMSITQNTYHRLGIRRD
jgi:hypothetical protein